MRTYKFARDLSGAIGEDVIRDDFASIPADPENRDWVEYQEWLVAGNVTLAADPIVPPNVIPVAALLARFSAAEQTALWTALATRPQVLGQLLVQIAGGMIDLKGARISALLDALVTAGVTTALRKTAILTP